MPAEVQEGIADEALAKWRPAADQRARMLALLPKWSELSAEWRAALLPPGTVAKAMADVGGATRPDEICAEFSNALADWHHVRDMRSRYTVLDFVLEAGLGS